MAKAGPALLASGVTLWRDAQEKKRLEAAIAEGVREARKTGQRGILVKVQYVETKAGLNKSVRGPVGNGAVFVGAGPDADTVCFATSCHQSLETFGDLNNPMRTADSVYYFLVESKDKAGNPVTVSSTYRSKELQERARTMEFSLEANRAQLYASSNQMVDGLVLALKRDAQSKEDRAEIDALLAARDKAREDIARIEKELHVELTRQEERAKDAKMLSNLAGILAVVNAVRTEDPGAGAAAESRIASGQAERTAALKAYDAVGSKIVGKGAQAGKTQKMRVPRVPPGPIPLPRGPIQERIELKPRG